MASNKVVKDKLLKLQDHFAEKVNKFEQDTGFEISWIDIRRSGESFGEEKPMRKHVKEAAEPPKVIIHAKLDIAL